MKTAYESLCCVIKELDIICGTLDSLRKRMEIVTPRVFLDDYYKILLAFEQLREVIENLRGVIKETKSVTSAT